MRATIRCASAALLLAAAGCAPPRPRPQQGFVSLPPDAVQGPGDPTRSAILSAAYAFGSRASLDGRPRRPAPLPSLSTSPPKSRAAPAGAGSTRPSAWGCRARGRRPRPRSASRRRRRPKPWWMRSSPPPAHSGRATVRRRSASWRRPPARTARGPCSDCPACRPCPPRTGRPAAPPRSWTAWTGSGAGGR